MTLVSALALLGFGAACFAAATGGALFRPGVWYEELKKPPWRPPNWLFGPVWMVLYGMIAVSGWLAWEAVGFAGAPAAFAIYAGQLVLNFGWSAVFFGLRRIGWAAIEMSALWLAIAANIAAFATISLTAALLLVPYLLWVSFALALNIAIWRLNSSGPGRGSNEGRGVERSRMAAER